MIPLPSTAAVRATLVVYQRYEANRSNHHAKNEQQFVVSVVAYVPPLGTIRDKAAATRETMRCSIPLPVRCKSGHIFSDECEYHILEAHLHHVAAAPADQRSKLLALLLSMLDQSA
ncbi:hypothetical protein [Bradyrhizobium guangxiense]|uniref:hypothetical protein n=1 Tax=Bradyrhizobium guangxiense TaxID=1325115 RepID=UPI0010091401|nr:hypothetical protein [Bradyrhizobium guangxiense]